jgi:hypothetical protein
VPDVDDGCFCGSICVEEGFDGGSGGFDIDSLELAIGVSDESAKISYIHRLLLSFHLSTLDSSSSHLP